MSGFRSETLSSSRIMDIPNTRLNSTDASATEFRGGEGKTANQRKVVREQIGSPRSRESVHLKFRPGRRVQSVSTLSTTGEASDNVITNCSALLLFVHSQIVTATIERPSRTSHRRPSTFSPVPRIAPGQFPAVGTAQTNTVSVRCEAASLRPRGRRLTAPAEMIEIQAQQPSEPVWAALRDALRR
jgi:hypothetical protein